MKFNLTGIPTSIQQLFKRIENKGIGPDNLSESYALKSNYPDSIRFRVNGSILQASLDGGATWKAVTLT